METTEFENVTCTKETTKAIQVQMHPNYQPIWIPKSVLGEDNEVCATGDYGTLSVATWFAEKEGIE